MGSTADNAFHTALTKLQCGPTMQQIYINSQHEPRNSTLILNFTLINTALNMYSDVECLKSPKLSNDESAVPIDADVDVDVEDLRAQANASMPASYIAN